MPRPLLPAAILALLPWSLPVSAAADEAGTAWQHVELRRFPAAEAFQGAAVDGEHFYAIANRAIGKYRKDTGERVASWEGERGGPVQHLNSGIVRGGRLLVAHSNFPDLPEESSLEIWDTATMAHIDRHVFEEPPGSLTWLVPEGDCWLACFAHYRRTSDPARSRVVRFDKDWKPLASWAFPAALIERFGGSSSSGGAFGPEGKLFVSGHDARELYVLGLPETKEGELTWEATVPVGTAGQAFAWDPTDPGLLYSIERKTREVVVTRIQRSGT